MKRAVWICLSMILVLLAVLSACDRERPFSCGELSPSKFPGSAKPIFDIKAVSDTYENEESCKSILTVDCLVDIWEDEEIDYFVINFDDKEWYSADTAIHENPYRKHLSKEVSCHRSYTLDTKAGFSYEDNPSRTETATKQVFVPPLGAKLEYRLEDIPGESGKPYKRYKLIINFEGSDLTDDWHSSMTNVQLKGNGIVWRESLSESPLNTYRDSYETVVTAGQNYQLEVVVTDWEGSRYTYSKTATVPRDAYMLTVKCSLGGEVILSSPKGQYKVSPGKSDSGPVVPGTDLSLNANAEPGYVFSSWDGDLTGTQNPATINMDRDKTITANFVAAPQQTMPPSPAIPGTICPKCGKPVNQCTCPR